MLSCALLCARRSLIRGDTSDGHLQVSESNTPNLNISPHNPHQSCVSQMLWDSFHSSVDSGNPYFGFKSHLRSWWVIRGAEGWERWDVTNFKSERGWRSLRSSEAPSFSHKFPFFRAKREIVLSAPQWPHFILWTLAPSHEASRSVLTVFKFVWKNVGAA